MTKFIYRGSELLAAVLRNRQQKDRRTVGYITKADHTGAYMIDLGHSPTIIKPTKKAATDHIESMADFAGA